MKLFGNILRAVFGCILILFGFDCLFRRKAVDQGILDFSGQGRNAYGR